MAMLIARFHRLIQSRALWGGILVIVIFTFVIWGIQSPRGARRAAEETAEGFLDGKPISPQEFRRAYLHTYMSVVLSLGRRFDINERLDEQIRESAWRRFVALREAEQLGLKTSDEEVRATIQGHAGFQVDRQFSPQAYAAFIQNVLGPLGFTAAQFEEHVREEITLQKLQRLLENLILVSPMDIQRTFRSLMDVFTLEYVMLSSNDVAEAVAVTEADAEALYRSDPEAFRMPVRVTVKYVALPISRFISEAQVTNETDALAYYDEHINDFLVTNLVTITNEPLMPGEEPQVITTTRVEALTFDIVKTNIFEIMSRQAARDKATELATEIVVALSPDREGNAPAFEDVCKIYDLPIQRLGPFSARDPLPEIEVPDLFKQAAFSLRPTPEEYISDAISGSNVVYVIALEKREEPRVPLFEEVKEVALEKAREKAIREALEKKAEDFRAKATQALSEGRAFADVAKEFGFALNRIENFSLSSEETTNTPPAILIRGILPRNQGEITDLLRDDDGTILIGYLAERKRGDMSAFSSLSPQIRQTIRQQRARLVFRDWEQWLLERGGFRDVVKERRAAQKAAEQEELTEEETNTLSEDTLGAEEE